MSDDGQGGRQPLHHRRIDMQGYRRDDGLFEVEGRVIDTKPHDYYPPAPSRAVMADAPIHDLALTLVFDADMIVVAVRTDFRAHPYAICPASAPAMQALVGLRIGAGWHAAIRKALPTAERCTHLAELLGPMATTALQSMSALRAGQPDPIGRDGRPAKIDSCYAYGAGRDLVATRWPDFHAPDEPTSDKG
jgi:hypothetical protein